MGVSTTAPLMKLHVKSDGDSSALFENAKALNLDVANALYFKTGSYTGALKTIGQSPSEARLSFFTSASPATTGLIERLSVLNNGNVGIGTTAPDGLLTVYGGDRGTGLNVISALNPAVSLRNNSAGGHEYQLFSTPLGASIGAGGFALYDNTAGRYNLTILSDGRMGVNQNTFSFSSMFNVKAADNTSTNFVFDLSNASNTSLLRVRNDGHVGIGIVTPNYPLHVVTQEIVDATFSSQHSSGTAVVGAGNAQSITTLPNGSGGAFTGYTTGLLARSTTGGTSEAIHTDNFGNVVRINYWNGTTQYKINGAGSVSTIVAGMNGEKVTLHAPETPEIYFQDYGEGKLVSGKAHIDIDPMFTKNVMIDQKHPLRVFIQPEGECNGVYVTNKTVAGFDVVELQGGQSNISFQWTITCNRADEDLGNGRISKNADARFEKAANPLNTVEVKNK